MICKRHCILTFRQLARTSTGPDTLFDASERPWANTAHNIAFDVDSFRATVHACIVRSFAAWSRRYAARMQRCTSELDLAMQYAAHQLQTCSLRKESAAEPANAQAETSASAITTHARYMLRCCRARPAFLREDAGRRGSNTSTQQEPQRPRQHSTTAASPQRS